MKYVVKNTAISTFDNVNFPNEIRIYYLGRDDHPCIYPDSVIGWKRRSYAEKYKAGMIACDKAEWKNNPNRRYWANHYEIVEIEKDYQDFLDSFKD